MNEYKVNIIFSFIFLAIAGIVWMAIPVGIGATANFTSGNEMLNSRFMPRVLVIILAFSCTINILINLLSIYLTKKTGKPIPVIKKPVLKKELNAFFLMFVFFLFAFLLERLGFNIAMAISCICVLAFLRVTKWHYYVVTFAFGIGMYFIFTRFLYVMLP
jgi:hypothetical protein